MRLAIALLLQHPGISNQADGIPDDWRSLDRPGIGLLSQLLDLVAAYPEITTAALIERWRGSESYPHLERLADPSLLRHIPAEGLGDEFVGALRRLNAVLAEAEAGRLFERTSPSQWTEEEKERLRQGGLKLQE
jgi:DNA primase